MEQPSGVSMPDEDDDDCILLVAMGRCHRKTVASTTLTREWSRRAAGLFCDIL